MMEHERILEMLARRSELSPGEEATVAQHLHGCPECVAAATAYQRQQVLMRSLPVAEPPPALRSGVLAQVAATRRRVPWWHAFRPRLAVPGVALAVVASVAGLIVAHRPTPATTPAAIQTVHTPRPAATSQATVGKPHRTTPTTKHHQTKTHQSGTHRATHHGSTPASGPVYVPTQTPSGGSIALGPPPVPGATVDTSGPSTNLNPTVLASPQASLSVRVKTGPQPADTSSPSSPEPAPTSTAQATVPVTNPTAVPPRPRPTRVPTRVPTGSPPVITAPTIGPTAALQVTQPPPSPTSTPSSVYPIQTTPTPTP